MAEEHDRAFDDIILIDPNPSHPDELAPATQIPYVADAEPPTPSQSKKRKFPDSFQPNASTSSQHGKKKKRGKAGKRGALGGKTRSQPTLVPTELGWVKDNGPPPAATPVPFREIVEYTISRVPIKFPFKAYSSQMGMMTQVIRSLQRSQHALLESPTGTGKTLALLVSVLAWREHERGRLTEEHNTLMQQYAEEYAKLVEGMANRSSPGASPARTNGENVAPKAKASSPKQPTPIAYDDGPSTHQSPSASTEAALAAQYAQPTLPKLPKIYFASRTQKQLQQVVRELRHNTVYRPRMSVLASRAHYCVNPEILHSKNRNDECDNLVRHNNCTYNNGVAHLKSRPEFKGTWDIEDILKVGKRIRGCPYYAARQLADSADIIFLPYNYVIDPLIREASGVDLAGNILIIDEAHNIEVASADAGSVTDLGFGKLTEAAHELDKLRIIDRDAPDEGYSALFNLAKALAQLKMDLPGGRIESEGNTKFSKIWAGQRILNVLEAVGITVSPESFQILRLGIQTANAKLEELRNPQTENQRAQQEEQRPSGSIWFMQVFESIVMVFGLLAEGFADDYRLVLIKEKMSFQSKAAAKYQDVDMLSSSEYSLEFWCMNPAVIFRKVANAARSVILTSGTLSPLSSFETELGVTFTQKLEATHVVANDQVWAGVITTSPPPHATALRGTYQNQQGVMYSDGIVESVRRIVKSVVGGGGILIFCQSYRVVSDLYQSLNEVEMKEVKQEDDNHDVGRTDDGIMRCEGRRLYVEPRANTQGEFDAAMADYSRAVKSGEGGVMICVQRGKMSEGIDFPNDLVRAVVIVGIPFPKTKDLKVKEKKAWNDWRKQSSKDDAPGLTGSEWYEVQAYRAVNQSLGRCIRHKEDWGAIVFLDERFQESKSQNMISRWARSRMRTFTDFADAKQSLAKFFEERADAENLKTQEAQVGDDRSTNAFVPTAAPVTPDKPRGGEDGEDFPPTPVSLRTRKVEVFEQVKVEDGEDQIGDGDGIIDLTEGDGSLPTIGNEVAPETPNRERGAMQKRMRKGLVDLSKNPLPAPDAEHTLPKTQTRDASPETSHILRCPRCGDAFLEMPSEDVIVTRSVNCPDLLRMRHPNTKKTTAEMKIIPAGIVDRDNVSALSGRKSGRNWAKRNAWYSVEDGRCYVWMGCAECGGKTDILG
ncbi:Fanconi anemia group J protein [Rhizophlyctis rosea]|uniref:DNA 5'-3' helicase n=1 Tax=Rhizophlyctis rosea TaxID=64517 RepID=A0AAD5SEV9_9FUNG|nr:Fanconi anemia group J protein [Rhizophlyctis rosea]